MIIIVPIGPFETATNFSIEALIGQVDILNDLGPSSQRASFIERLKEQAKYLLDVIEKSEGVFIEEIENFSDGVLDQTASVRNDFIRVSGKINDPTLREMSEVVSDAHNKAVKFLGEEELEAINRIRETTAELKNKADKLITYIEKIRVR